VKAAQVVAHRRIEIVDVEQPSIDDLAVGGLLVKPLLSAICGTDIPGFDLKRADDEYPLSPGMTIHESIGVVCASRSERYSEGDEVLALPRGNGALAEYYLSHESVAVPLRGTALKEHLLMAQPLGTVIWALRKLGNLLGQDAVVVGQGPNGLLITHMLSNLGARRVIGVDQHDYRLQVAKKMRATHTVNADRDESVDAISELTDGAMGDIVVEAVGHQTGTINQCLKMVKRGGTVLAFGVPDEKVYPIRYRDFFRRNVRLIGSVMPEAQRDFPLAMDMIVQGRVDVAPMLTHRLPFTEAQRAMELSVFKRDGAIKIVFDHG